MKKIEDNIRKNQILFDDSEPKAGHFERFAEKLEHAGSVKRKSPVLRLGFIWRVAAAVLILIAVSVIYNQIDNLSLIQSTHSNELPIELIEASNYYATLNREKIEMISEIAGKDPEKKEVVTIALQEAEALDQSSADLKEKYIETKDDRVIDAIITNYRVLGALLDHIIERVNESR
jgi:hypothetical protein